MDAPPAVVCIALPMGASFHPQPSARISGHAHSLDTAVPALANYQRQQDPAIPPDARTGTARPPHYPAGAVENPAQRCGPRSPGAATRAADRATPSATAQPAEPAGFANHRLPHAGDHQWPVPLPAAPLRAIAGRTVGRDPDRAQLQLPAVRKGFAGTRAALHAQRAHAGVRDGRCLPRPPAALATPAQCL